MPHTQQDDRTRKKILIMRPGALGDTLMLAPALKSLTSTQLVMVAGRKPGLDFLASVAHRLFDMERAPWHMVFTPRSAPAPPVDTSPDLIVCFLSDPEGVVKSNLKAWYPEATVRLYPSLPRPERKLHASLHVALCLKDSGLPLKPEVVHKRAMDSPVLGFQGDAAKRYIVLHPGSGSRRKNHPLSFWKELFFQVLEISKPKELNPAFLLGPAELDAQKELEAADLGQHVLLSTSSGNLFRILTQTALFIGHDSGPTHLASMMGIPTVSLFKSTDPALWHPLGPCVTIVEGNNSDSELMDKVISHVKIFRC